MMIDWEGIAEDAFDILCGVALSLVFLFFIILMGGALYKLILEILH